MTYSRIHSLIERLLILPAIVLCIGSPGVFAAAIGTGDYYVSGEGDDSTGDGSEGNPWRTITHAFAEVGQHAPTIYVGSGIYDSVAGEVFPINVDSSGPNGFNLVGYVPGLHGSGTDSGPGSGGASEIVVNYGALNEDGNMMESKVPMQGDVMISGLTFRGEATSTSGSSPLVGAPRGEGFILDLNDDGEGEDSNPYQVAVVMQDNEASFIGLLDVHELTSGDVVITNNVVGNAETGVHVSLEVGNWSTTGETNQVNVLFQSNELFNCSEGLQLDVELEGGNNKLIFDVDVVANTFMSSSTAIDGSFSASSGEFVIELNIEGNTLEMVQNAMVLNCYGYEGASYERNLSIVDNHIIAELGVSQSIEMSTTSHVWNDNVKVIDNLIEAINEGDGCGFYAEVEVEDPHVVNDLDWLIEGNRFEGQEVGLLLSYAMELSSNVLDYDLTIRGNDFIGQSGAGILVSMELDSGVGQSGSLDMDQFIEKNRFDDVGIGIALYQSAAYGGFNKEDVVRGNLIRGAEVPFEATYNIYTSSSATGNGSAHFNAGVPGAYGYNVINYESEDWSSSSIYLSGNSKSASIVKFDLVGNWWGTQDSVAIGERIFPASSQIIDLSNPLPDSLSITAEVVDFDFPAWEGWGSDFSVDLPPGVGAIVFTAGSDAGFVSRCGREQAQYTIEGPPFVAGFGDIFPESFYSPDYKQIALPYTPGDGVPEGDYSICFYNPAGQFGCVDFTIEGDGEDEDCSQNQIPTAVSEDADTDAATAINVDVTANDWDPNGNLDPTHVEIVDTPDKGSAVVNEDGSITYTPDADLLDDADALTYVVYDTCGSPSNAATLHIRVGGHVNLIPTAGYDEVETEMDAAITIDVLSNDYDPDGALDAGSVQLIDTPDKGTAVVNADGSITYTPNQGLVATTDTFTYTVNDDLGATSNAATVGVQIKYAIDSEDITSGVGGNAGGRKTQGTRGGLGNGGTPTYGGTRNP